MNRLIIICGKTNSGKSTLKNALLQHGFESIVTYTTRSPRPGEVNGVDYHFVSEEEFENLKKGQLLEWSGYTKDGQIVQVGSSKESYMQPGKHVAILDAAGLKALKESNTPYEAIIWIFQRRSLFDALDSEGQKMKSRLWNGWIWKKKVIMT